MDENLVKATRLPRVAALSRRLVMTAYSTAALFGLSLCGGGIQAQEQKPEPAPAAPRQAESGTGSESDPKPTLAQILLRDVDPEMLQSSATRPESYAIPKLDFARLAQAGIRQCEGKHLILLTDLPPDPAIEELPGAFDLATLGWARYLGISAEELADWRLLAYLMGNEETFRELGLLPADLPLFLHGYQRGFELWLRDQPSMYYRRHLLLHEGVHGFMSHHLHGLGPPWYREGMAELLATHRWKRGKMQVGVMPRAREEVPYWGRIKLVQEEYAAQRGKMIDQIMQFRSEDYLTNEAYAWSWAAVTFLDSHPSFRGLFRTLKNFVTESPMQFNRRMLEIFQPQLRELDEQWQLFVVNLDYGYDFATEVVAYGPGQPLQQAQDIRVEANRGWQSSGVHVELGRSYAVSATGQFQLQQRPQSWPCEAGGITIQYYRGAPLGMLLGSVRPDEARPGMTNLANPFRLGLGRTFRPTSSGTLYLRVNDHPAQVADNTGEITVTVSPLPSPAERKDGAQGAG